MGIDICTILRALSGGSRHGGGLVIFAQRLYAANAFPLGADTLLVESHAALPS